MGIAFEYHEAVERAGSALADFLKELIDSDQLQHLGTAKLHPTPNDSGTLDYCDDGVTCPCCEAITLLAKFETASER